MSESDLLDFLKNRMSMTGDYQPVVIRELLLHGGERTKAELANVFASRDRSVQEYYERIMMRWPKATLVRHGIIEYSKLGSVFRLSDYPSDETVRSEALRVCDEKLQQWEERKETDATPECRASVRYEVLKEAGGKCQLCGIPASIRPMDVDHIVPRSKADRNGKVRVHGRLVDVDDRENLQALCFTCNRAKRNKDQTDFRRREKLVRDRIPDIIRAEGREPDIKELTGRALTEALREKLAEEHAEFLGAKDAQARLEELADILEVVLALAEREGLSEAELLGLVQAKRATSGGFSRGFLLRGET